MACVGVLVHAVLPDGLGRDLLFLGIGAGAAVTTVRARRRMTSPARGAWLLLSLALGAWLLGDLARTLLDRGLGVDPSPSVADLASIASYPLLVGGLIRAFPAPPGRRPVWWLDAFLMTGGVLLGLWLFVLDPALAVWSSDPGASLVGALHVIGAALVLVTLVRSGAALRDHRSAYRLTAVAVLLVLVADLLSQLVQGSAAVDGRVDVLDPLWLVGYVLLARAAREQDGAGTAPPGPGSDLTGVHFALMAVSASLVPSALIVAGVRGDRVPIVEVCSIGILMVAAMMSRFWGVLGDLRRKNVRLAQDAVTDPLTGLANAAGLQQHVERAASQAPEGTSPALLLVALDGYRDVVETLGHHVADEMLVAVGHGLAAVAPPGATVARLSRDLFAVSVDVTPGGPADLVAETVLERLGTTVTVAGMRLMPGALIGVAAAAGRPTSFTELIARADVALWSARRGPDRVAEERGGGPEDPARSLAGTELLRDLVGAVERGELVVHFQPVTTVATGKVLAAEALVRWQHPVHGLLGPADFIPAAERTGLIRPVTLAVVDEALRWCALWRETVPDFAVAVNISAHDVDDPRLVDDMQRALDRHDLPPSALALEVTETMAMRDVPRAERTLRALAALGVHLSVDDYGVGYGSLDYLRRLPFTVLKVDRAFVAPSTSDPVCASILRSTVALGHALGMHVVAEGVEDAATLALLAELDCDSAQGWALGRPTTAAGFTELLAVAYREPDEARPAGRAERSSAAGPAAPVLTSHART